jgi:WD40 repeat protein
VIIGTVATADNNGGAYLWSIGSGKRIATLTQPISPSDPNGDDAADSVAFSPTGTTVTVGYSLGHTDTWNVASGRPVAALPRVAAMALSPNGRIFAAVNTSGSLIYLGSMATGKFIATFSEPAGGSLVSVTAVAFSPDGRILAIAYENGYTCLWSISNGQRIATLSDPSLNPPDAIAFSSDGSMIAVGDDNKNAPGTPAGAFLFKVSE